MTRPANLQFVGSLPQLEAALQYNRARVALGGELVLASLKPLEPGEGFIRQVDRSLDPFNLPFIKSKQKLSVWVSRDALRMLSRARRVQGCLVLDFYLKWLKHCKQQDFILIGGQPSLQDTVVLYFVVLKGTLNALEEKSLPPASSARFTPAAVSLIEKLKLDYPQATLHWAAPLPDLADAQTACLDERIFQNSAPRLRFGNEPGFLTRHGSAMAVSAAAVALYCAALAWPYHRYLQGVKQFKEESASLQTEFEYASDLLKLMQERKRFLAESAHKGRRLQDFEKALAATGQADYPVREALIRLHKNARPGDPLPPDLELTLEVAKAPELTAVEQSIPILSELSARSAATLRLAQFGHRDLDEAGGRGRRLLKIEGDFVEQPFAN